MILHDKENKAIYGRISSAATEPCAESGPIHTVSFAASTAS
jgi:hypothetical protein